MAMEVRKVGRYEILEEIGHGGQSTAYKARDPKIDRIVAIKQIRSAAGMSDKVRSEFYARFMREAQAAGRLSHPNIAIIYDVGGDEEGEPYIAMEYIDGVNLDDLITTSHPLESDRIFKIFLQLCSALHYAHQCGIVHRDIKPGNIMVTRDVQVKVVDFGIAKLASSNLTQTGTIMGTPSYMSPEQIMGKPVDHRSDIFSVGVVLYEALTGERPFTGENPTTIIFKIVHEPHLPAIERKPTLQPGFDEVLSKALAKDPAPRYQSCAEMGRDLERLRGARPAITGNVAGEHDTAPITMLQTQAMPTPLAGAMPGKPAATEPGARSTTAPTLAPADTPVSAGQKVSTPRIEAANEAAADGEFRPGGDSQLQTQGASVKVSKLWAALVAAVVICILLGLGAVYWFPGGKESQPATDTAAVPAVQAQQAAGAAVELLNSAQTALSQGLLVGDDKKDALYFIHAALASDPSNTEAAKLKLEVRTRAARQAEEKAQKGKPEDAVTAYENLLKYFPDEAEIQSKRDAAQARLSRLRLAADLDRARKAGDKAYRALNYAEAIQQFGSLVQMDPQNAAAFYFLGRSYAERQNPDKAVENLTRAADLETKNPTYAIHLALALENKKSFAAALNYLQKAIELGGDSEFGVPSLKARANHLKLRSDLAGLTPYSTNARHDHFLGSGCDGALKITDTTVSFAPVKQKEHAFQAGVESLRSFIVKKTRLEMTVADGKKYSFQVPDPAPLTKISELLSKSR